MLCYLGNRRVAMAWGVWTCPTWERMRLFPDAEGILCMSISAYLRQHNTTQHPFTSFILAAYTYACFPKVEKCGIRREEAIIKDLTYFQNYLLSLCSSCPPYKAQPGVKGLVTVMWEPSSRGSSWILSQSAALIVPTHSPLLLLHAFIFLACFVSGFRCKVLCSVVV